MVTKKTHSVKSKKKKVSPKTKSKKKVSPKTKSKKVQSKKKSRRKKIVAPKLSAKKELWIEYAKALQKEVVRAYEWERTYRVTTAFAQAYGTKAYDKLIDANAFFGTNEQMVLLRLHRASNEGTFELEVDFIASEYDLSHHEVYSLFYGYLPDGW